MKGLIISLLFFMFMGIGAHAQVFERQSVSSGGTVFLSEDGIAISQTIGQPYATASYYGNDFTEEKEEQTIIKENKILQNLKDKNNAILLEKSSESLNYSRKYGKDGEVSPYPTEKQLEILMQSGFNSSLALKSNYNSFIKHSERVFSVTEDRKCCLYCNLI